MPDSDFGANPQLSWSIYLMLLWPRTWIHRRVESIQLIDETTAVRRVSVDLTVPRNLPAADALTPVGAGSPWASRLRVPPDEDPSHLSATDHNVGSGAAAAERRTVVVPIALLAKRSLVHFDLQNEAGTALSLLTTEQNTRLSAAVLLELAYSEQPEVCDSLVPKDIRCLVGDDDQIRRREALGRCLNERTEVSRYLVGLEGFRALATDLERYFVAYARLDALPGQRRIVKFSYESYESEVTAEPNQRGLRTFFGWRPFTYSSEELPVGFGDSYHIEIEAPPESEFSYASLVCSDRASGVEPPNPENSWQTPCDFDLPAGRIHFHATPTDRGTSGRVLFGIRIRRTGMLRALVVAGIISAGVLLAIRLRLWEFRSHSGDSDAVAALLATFPALLATYVLQPGEHAVVGRILRGPRLMLLISGAIAFLGALSLFANFSHSTLALIWTIFVCANVTLAALLSASYFLPLPARQSD
jgi:hypothetical protein